MIERVSEWDRVDNLLNDVDGVQHGGGCAALLGDDRAVPSRSLQHTQGQLPGLMTWCCRLCCAPKTSPQCKNVFLLSADVSDFRFPV